MSRSRKSHQRRVLVIAASAALGLGAMACGEADPVESGPAAAVPAPASSPLSPAQIERSAVLRDQASAHRSADAIERWALNALDD